MAMSSALLLLLVGSVGASESVLHSFIHHHQSGCVCVRVFVRVCVRVCVYEGVCVFV